jgi:hypothetical protein
LGLQGQSNEALDLVISDPPRCTGARGIAQAIQAVGQETLAPSDDALPADAKPLGMAVLVA